jgi:hypothetical protein
VIFRVEKFSDPRDFQMLICGAQRHLTSQVCARSYPSATSANFTLRPQHFAEITLSRMTAAPAAIVWRTFQLSFLPDPRTVIQEVWWAEDCFLYPQNMALLSFSAIVCRTLFLLYTECGPCLLRIAGLT